MKHGHSCNTSDELEVGEVILVAQARVGIDLESVVVPADTEEASHFLVTTVCLRAIVFKCISLLWHSERRI